MDAANQHEGHHALLANGCDCNADHPCCAHYTCGTQAELYKSPALFRIAYHQRWALLWYSLCHLPLIAHAEAL